MKAKKPIKLIIAGSRTFNNSYMMDKELNHLILNLFGYVPLLKEVQKRVTIISGTASGADIRGERWAIQRAINIDRFPADWEQYGKAAGPIRNRQMASIATHAIIFWDGKSRGSKNMIDTCKEMGLPHKVIMYK